MAIHYSLGLRNKNVINNDEKRVYAQAQSTSNMTLKEFSTHIAEHGSVFGRDVIEGVLIKAVECMREQLLLGRIVELGDLGRFYVSLSSEGVEDASLFTAKNIKKVNVKWAPGADFKNLKDEATFEYVTTRDAQALAKKAAKDELLKEMGIDTGSGVDGE